MDVVHVQWPIPNGLGALFLKWFYHVPYINTIHGEEVYLSKRYHTMFIIKSMVNHSFKTITNSSATLKACLDAGLDQKKLDTIPFGVDTSFYKPIEVTKDEEVFQILSVGYMIERKGHKYLIMAVKELLKHHSNVRLKIVGSGPLEHDLHALIKDLKLEKVVEIVSNLSDQKLLEIYNSSDLFVLSSIVDSQGNTEGLGVVLLEAMACGLPVIGSNIGGIPDIIQHNENGLLVQEKNYLELKDSIKLIIEDSVMRQRVAHNGYKMVNKYFSWEIIASEYIENYNLGRIE